MKDVKHRRFIWRFAGFCSISCLYGLLAFGFILLAPSFHELSEGFGLDLNWFARILIEKPWIYTFPAIIVPAIQLAFFVGVTWGSWPQAAYTRVANASMVFLVLLFVSAAFVLYGNIFKLGAVV